MDYSLIFDEFLQISAHRLDFIKKQLALCPEGRLGQQTAHGKPYFVQSVGKGETLVRRGISTQPELVIGLLRRSLLERERDCLLSQQQLCEESLRRLHTFDLSAEIKKLRAKCPAITDELLEKAMLPQGESEWIRSPYEQSDYLVANKRHVTSRGLHVRSKSELLISEKLYEHGLPFRYEQPLIVFADGSYRFGNSDAEDRSLNAAKESFASRCEELPFASSNTPSCARLLPDFTIRRADGRIFLWEHQGLMSLKEYAKKQQQKSIQYANAGFVPWKNLIVTYDSDNGNLDLRTVEAEIQIKLLL